MKFTIRLLLITALTTSSGLYAADPTFHLKNKSNESIQIEIKQGNSIIKKLTSIAKGGELKYDINISKPTILDMYICGGKCNTKLPDTMTVTFINPDTNSPVTGKTMYLKWNGKELSAQKGNKLGATTKGYSSKNNIDPITIRTSTVRGKALTTGTKESVAEEVARGEKEIRDKKAKPAIATTKPAKKGEQSTIAIGAQRTPAPKPKEVYKTPQEIEAEAWQQFPKANEYRKKNSRDYDFMMYMSLFGMKDEGTYADLKQQLKEKYKQLWNSWNPDEPGLSLNEQLVARKIREILNSAEPALKAKINADEAEFMKNKQ